MTEAGGTSRAPVGPAPAGGGAAGGGVPTASQVADWAEWLRDDTALCGGMVAAPGPHRYPARLGWEPRVSQAQPPRGSRWPPAAAQGPGRDGPR